MGLDNFWKNSDGQTAYIKEASGVCGGMMSDNGESSFRGKVYYDIVKQATGVNLYDDKIPNEIVKKMADDLENYDLKSYKNSGYGYPIDEKEFESLKKMFRLHADAGNFLVSFW